MRSSGNQVEGLQLNKDDMNSYVRSVFQNCSVEMFCLPSSDGTPMVELNYPVHSPDKIGLVEDSFIFVANQVALDESLELPLAIVHVDKSAHWKRL